MAEEHRLPRRKKAALSIAVLLTLSCTSIGRVTAAEGTAAGQKAGNDAGGKMIAIAIHGGAGTLPRAEISSEQEKQYLAGLDAALDAGYAVLKRDGTSLDATIAAVRVLEDNPLFNAGRGAVLNRDGIAELDASVMDGKTLSAGAVSGLRHVKSPIELARLVMDKSPHVMLVGAGAEEFAKLQGVEVVPNEYFVTPVRKLQLERLLRGAVTTKENDLAAFGTVGAVALDSSGNLAAATSTGGMTGKRWGRVGDSPIIGAGTYANNASCAVSATGHGEFFIRTVVAHDICAQVEYLKIPLAGASANVLAKMKALGGNGGVIAIDPKGEVVLDFNSEGMFRGVATSKGRREVAIFR
ncbi:MAG: isoaspartyl peptidase/L-asparaginase [Steroidobacteraceae bacterium]|nr:isoaspartyl peptidase/L-asparaginase [Steroidobacteraceae bacterium]